MALECFGLTVFDTTVERLMVVLARYKSSRLQKLEAVAAQVKLHRPRSRTLWCSSREERQPDAVAETSNGRAWQFEEVQGDLAPAPCLVVRARSERWLRSAAGATTTERLTAALAAPRDTPHTHEDKAQRNANRYNLVS